MCISKNNSWIFFLCDEHLVYFVLDYGVPPEYLAIVNKQEHSIKTNANKRSKRNKIKPARTTYSE